jgi:glutamyl-tRNA reductase
VVNQQLEGDLIAMQNLFLLGCSHHTAPLEVRERISLNAEGVQAATQELSGLSSLREWAILNTCNRLEFYGVSESKTARAEMDEWLSHFPALDANAFLASAFWQEGVGVVQHLFEVSSGLDSQMVGETEILGQVKDAYADAVARKSVGTMLNQLFQKSFQAAKWARTHTGIGRGHVSIGNVAVELATRIFGNLSKSRILIIGTGEVGEATVQSLQSRGCRSVTITSRTFENAADLARKFQGSAVAFADFKEQLDTFDIVISATDADGIILQCEDIDIARARRRGHPMFLIDLAMPRDIDQRAALLENIFLYNLDDLSAIANENLRQRQKEVEICKESLAARARRFWDGIGGA